MTERKQVRLSHITFALVLEELMSGPCTAMHLAEHSGMGHRYVRRLLRTMREKKLAHIASWEKDSRGRQVVMVFALGHGRDAPRRTKSREAVNRDYRNKAAQAPLRGTPFYGLGA